MAYYKEKLESNYYKATSSYKSFLIGNTDRAIGIIQTQLH